MSKTCTAPATKRTEPPVLKQTERYPRLEALFKLLRADPKSAAEMLPVMADNVCFDELAPYWLDAIMHAITELPCDDYERGHAYWRLATAAERRGVYKLAGEYMEQARTLLGNDKDFMADYDIWPTKAKVYAEADFYKTAGVEVHVRCSKYSSWLERVV